MKRTLTMLFSTAMILLMMAMPGKVTAQLGCPTPTGLTTSNIDLFSAELDWNNSIFAQNSLLEIRIAGTNTWIPVIIQQTPYTVQPLLCGTDYEWRVSAICQLGPIILPSNPSAVQSFSTLGCNNLCPAPSALTSSNVNDNSAELSWTPAFAFLTDYNLRYREVGSMTWTDVNNVSTPYSLMSLNCATDYEWQVQTLCPNPFGAPIPGAWTASSNFSTDICPVLCDVPGNLSSSNIGLYNADLSWDNALAPGATYQLRYRLAGAANWTLVAGATSPYSLTGLSCSSSFEWGVRTECTGIPGAVTAYSAWSANHLFGTIACTSPCPSPMNLTTTNIGLMTADLSWATTAPQPNDAQVRYREVGTSAWTFINNATSPVSISGLNCDLNYEWQVRTACALSLGSVTYSAWSGLETFASAACNSICPGPQSLTTSNISLNSAEFSWSIMAPFTVDYQLRYREMGAAAWNFTASTSSPFSATGLNCDADYEWQVRTVCGGGISPTISYSPWSILQFFSTLNCAASCPGPHSMATANIGLYGATLDWSVTAPGTVGFDIHYRQAGAANWVQVDNVTAPYALSGLLCSTGYEWEVRTVCGNNVSNDPVSAWSATQSFTTATCTQSCAAPNGLSTSAITETDATLSWVATAPGATSYQLRYRSIGGGWTLVNNAVSPYSVSGLVCATDYQWQVRTVCGSASVGNYSPWSVLNNFTTNACPSAFTQNSPVTMDIFPNPASERFSINFDSEESIQAVVEMKDMFGKTVYSSARSLATGMNELTIPTASLFEGWYSVTLKTVRTTSTAKVLISH